MISLKFIVLLIFNLPNYPKPIKWQPQYSGLCPDRYRSLVHFIPICKDTKGVFGVSFYFKRTNVLASNPYIYIYIYIYILPFRWGGMRTPSPSQGFDHLPTLWYFLRNPFVYLNLSAGQQYLSNAFKKFRKKCLVRKLKIDWIKITRMFEAGQSPECSDCLLI